MIIEEGRQYTNIKTGKAYRVLHIAVSAWDSAQLLAVYQDIAEKKVWVRSITEFKEKFEEAEK